MANEDDEILAAVLKTIDDNDYGTYIELLQYTKFENKLLVFQYTVDKIEFAKALPLEGHEIEFVLGLSMNYIPAGIKIFQIELYSVLEYLIKQDTMYFKKLQIIWDSYTNHDICTITKLYKYAALNNAGIARFLQDKLKKLSGYAKGGSYLIVNDAEFKEPKYIEPNKYEVIHELIEKYKIDVGFVNEVNEVKMKQDLESADLTEASKVIFYSRYDPTEIGKYFGPINKFENEILDGKYECAKYGGCRMLLCNHYNRYDDDLDVEDPMPEWFTDNCDYCNLKIKHKTHAVRVPMKMGGWSGTFCSFNCIQNFIQESPGCDSEESDAIFQLTKACQIILNEKGIYTPVLPEPGEKEDVLGALKCKPQADMLR
jgi:hypothetical protein